MAQGGGLGSRLLSIVGFLVFLAVLNGLSWAMDWGWYFY